MTMHYSRIAIAAAISSFALPAIAQRSLLFDTKLKSVAIFRDGYGYYVREGKAKLQDGWATTTFVPSAIRGSVWVYCAPGQGTIDTVVSTQNNALDIKSAKDIKTKLADKIGIGLSVVLKNGQKFEGQLSKLLDDMLLLQVGAAYSAVTYDQIQSISFVGYPLKIKIDSKDPNGTVDISIAYLQEGIRWEPSYMLTMVDGKATLSLRANLQNTTEKLEDDRVQFVVGSPFVANRGIADMLGAALGPAAPGAQAGAGGLSAAAAGNFAAKDVAERRDKGAQAPESASVTGDEAEELFYYTKTGLSLDTNEVAMISIFEDPIVVSPVFEWNADGDDVDYLLSITNTTKQPLTTGPVFVVEDGKALGQETVRYTAAGDTAQIRLSRGIGVKVERVEAETGRSGPVKFGKGDYFQISLGGTLTLTNLRKKPATVTVTRTARGLVKSMSDGGTVVRSQTLNGEPNPINDMKWKVVVEPGKTKSLNYTFETYIAVGATG